jgi:hypothetical protein
LIRAARVPLHHTCRHPVDFVSAEKLHGFAKKLLAGRGDHTDGGLKKP